jgi:hypothetical protein
MEGQEDGIKGYKPVVNGEGRKTRSSRVKILFKGTDELAYHQPKQKYTFENIV